MDDKYNIIVYNCETHKVEEININQDYYAISYRWGDKKDVKKWNIDTPYGITTITSFSERSFKYFSKKCYNNIKAKYIWVDCISINQQLENSDKIKFLMNMPEIYKKAKYVIAAPWLCYGYLHNYNDKNEKTIKMKQLNIYYEWVNRSWVHQEINSANNILFTLAKPFEYSKNKKFYNDVYMKKRIYDAKVSEDKIQEFNELIGPDNEKFIENLVDFVFSNLNGGLNTRRNNLNIFINKIIMLKSVEKGNFSLEELIYLIMYTESTIETDKIYALLPLSNIKIDKNIMYESTNHLMKEIIKNDPKAMSKIVMSTYICNKTPSWLFDNNISYYNNKIPIPIKQTADFLNIEGNILKIKTFILSIENTPEINKKTKKEDIYKSEIIINKTKIEIQHYYYIDIEKKSFLSIFGEDNEKI
jgi:hypothetical protein